MFWLKLIIIPFAIFYVFIIGLIYFSQREMLYHPEPEHHPLSYYNLSNTQELTLTTKDQIEIQVWFRPPDKGHDIVIFLHGNAGNLENRIEHLSTLASMGYGYIIPAWRGFGKSQGKPSMEGLYLDAESVIDFIQQKNYHLNKTIMVGESLGTGIATKMATKYKFKGLFLITPYTSIADRAGELFPFIFSQYLTKDNFKVLDNITKIQQPLLIIHGTNDTVIPHQHSEKIFAAANEPKKLIIYQGANHVNYDKKAAFTAMKDFFTE